MKDEKLLELLTSIKDVKAPNKLKEDILSKINAPKYIWWADKRLYISLGTLCACLLLVFSPIFKVAQSPLSYNVENEHKATQRYSATQEPNATQDNYLPKTKDSSYSTPQKSSLSGHIIDNSNTSSVADNDINNLVPLSPIISGTTIEGNKGTGTTNNVMITTNPSSTKSSVAPPQSAASPTKVPPLDTSLIASAEPNYSHNPQTIDQYPTPTPTPTPSPASPGDKSYDNPEPKPTDGPKLVPPNPDSPPVVPEAPVDVTDKPISVPDNPENVTVLTQSV